MRVSAVLATVAFSLLASAEAQVNPAVVTISASRLLGKNRVGSGLCLDNPCMHVITNYHVAAALGNAMKVEGVSVAGTQLYTGPQDEGAQPVDSAAGVMRYNLAKDLALLTLKKALPSQFKSFSFSMAEPHVGEHVVRTARVGETYDSSPGIIVSDSLSHKSAAGAVTILPGHFLLDCPSRPGNSGGAVLDVNGKVIGIVTMRSFNDEGHAGTIAISAATVHAFLKEANEALCAKLFASPDVQSVVASEASTLPAGLGRVIASDRPSINLIEKLRVRAEQSSAAMRNLLSLESIRTWANNQVQTSWRFEVSMSPNGTAYRKIGVNGATGGSTPYSELVWPNLVGLVPGEQWSLLPQLVNDAAIQHHGTSNYEGQPVHVFHYVSSATGCAFRYGGRNTFGGCSGWIVADLGMNPFLVTQSMRLVSGEARQIDWTQKYHFAALTRGKIWVPSELQMRGKFRTGKTYWASAHWTDYREFGSTAIFSAIE